MQQLASIKDRVVNLCGHIVNACDQAPGGDYPEKGDLQAMKDVMSILGSAAKLLKDLEPEEEGREAGGVVLLPRRED